MERTSPRLTFSTAMLLFWALPALCAAQFQPGPAPSLRLPSEFRSPPDAPDRQLLAVRPDAVAERMAVARVSIRANLLRGKKACSSAG